MTASSTAAAVAAQRFQLLDAGWNPVPASPVDKGCHIRGWPTIETSEYHIENWIRTNPAHTNTAFVTNRNYFAIDADTLDKPLTDRIVAAAFDHCGVTPFVRVGRAPKALLVYQKETPASVLTSRYKFDGRDGDGLEILSGSKGANGQFSGAVFTAFGIHPETQQPYRWIGEANPLEDAPDEAPVVGQSQVDAFIKRVRGFAPFVVNLHGSASDAERAYNSDGLVTDGRENLMRDCVLQAARESYFSGVPLEMRSVSDRGWELFQQRAWLGDGKWTYKRALAKAASTIRRIRDGRLKLEPGIAKANCFSFADVTRMPLKELRSRLRVQSIERITTMFSRGEPAMSSPDRNAPPLQPEQRGPTSVHALEVTTGSGKTRIAAETFAAGIKEARARGDNRPVAYFVPTHRLGEDIAALFAEYGLSAKVWRGRDAKVPGSQDRKMCDDLEKVKLALKCGLPVAETCCRKKKVECPFYRTCSYQRQAKAKPDVWILAHEGLFHENASIDEPAGIIIDESFWQDGIIHSKWEMTIDDISILAPKAGKKPPVDLQSLHEKLILALGQEEFGGVRREHAARWLSVNECTEAIKLQWASMPKVDLRPDAKREDIAIIDAKVPYVQFGRRMVRIWKAMRELLEQPDDAVSGRVYIAKDKKSRRVIGVRGVRKIPKQWNVTSYIIDATLPRKEILQVYHPQVEVIGRWQADDLPHAEIRQYLNAPVTQKRLMKTGTNCNRNAIRRHILQRWIEAGRQETLVICQQNFEAWLKGAELPENVHVEHFNNVAGLDRYKDVRLLITIGRTLPGPEVVEALAGALTGVEPPRVEPREGGRRWYKQEVRGGLLADGTFPAIQCDTHPDPLCEAIRFQICEGELIQAIGRARAVNRMASTPVDIDILANICLPVELTDIAIWREPSSLIEMFAAGIVLTNRADMVRCWPDVWPNEKAAQRALRDLPEAMRQQAGTSSYKERQGPETSRLGHLLIKRLCGKVPTFRALARYNSVSGAH